MVNYLKNNKIALYFLKVLIHPFLFCIYFLSGLFPRNQKIWVFGSWDGKRFADNSKYLFLYVVYNKKNIKSVWITKNRELLKKYKDKDFNLYYYLSVRGIYYTLRAGLFVFDCHINDINFWLSRGSRKVNLWHGMPIKKIGAMVKKNGEFNPYYFNGLNGLLSKFFLPWNYINTKVDFLFINSVFFKNIFSSSFLLDKNKIFITGQPRNDIFYKKSLFNFSDKEVNLIKKTINQKKRKGFFVALYMPTFRSDGSNFLSNSEELLDLNYFCKKNKIIIFAKNHPKIKINSKNFSNIKFINKNIDAHPILELIDLLITDYSSIYIDFLIINRPIIFFSYDFNNYKIKDRDFCLDYKKFTPGIFVQNFKEFKESLLEVRKRDDFENERRSVFKVFFSYNDSCASEIIFNKIIGNK